MKPSQETKKLIWASVNRIMAQCPSNCRDKLRAAENNLNRFDWDSFVWSSDADFIDTRTYSYLRNIRKDGFLLKNSFELVTKKTRQTTNYDIPDTKELNEMGVSGWWDQAWRRAYLPQLCYCLSRCSTKLIFLHQCTQPAKLPVTLFFFVSPFCDSAPCQLT